MLMWRDECIVFKFSGENLFCFSIQALKPLTAVILSLPGFFQWLVQGPEMGYDHRPQRSKGSAPGSKPRGVPSAFLPRGHHPPTLPGAFCVKSTDNISQLASFFLVRSSCVCRNHKEFDLRLDRGNPAQTTNKYLK